MDQFLIGVWRFETTKVGHIRAGLQIIEICFERIRNHIKAGEKRCLQISIANPSKHIGQFILVPFASHKQNACDAMGVALQILTEPIEIQSLTSRGTPRI